MISHRAAAAQPPGANRTDVAELVEELRGRNAAVAVGFADRCTYGALVPD